MRFSVRFILFAVLGVLASVLTASVAAGALAPAPAHGAAAQYTLTIRGIDRAGKKVSIEPSVFGATNGVDYLTYLSSVTVPAGTYVVAAPVPEPGQNSGTLVARMVRVRSDMTVTLSAVKAVPVVATLSGRPSAAVMQANQQGMLCVRTGHRYVQVTGLLVAPTLVRGNASPGTLYVKPMAGRGLRFVYQTYWGGPAGLTGPSPFYDQAAAYNGGMPQRAAYHQAVAGLAQVHVQLRSGENATALRNVVVAYDGCGSLALPWESLGKSYTDHRTPGSWLTRLNFGPTESNITRVLVKTGSYLGGHVYTDILGSAVAGPEADFPVTDGADVTFTPHDIFADPLVSMSEDCDGLGRVTLAHSGATVLSRKLRFCGKGTRFSAAPPTAGRYTLTADFARPPGRGVVLSSSVSLAWSFRYAPVTGHAVNKQAAPVTVTEFRVGGLSNCNEAGDGTTTTLQVSVLRGGGQAVATPRYRLAKVQVWASVSNGRSWHTLALRPHAGGWLASIANPGGGGFVSLRSIVTDTHGDSTAETLTRAYQVGASC